MLCLPPRTDVFLAASRDGRRFGMTLPAQFGRVAFPDVVERQLHQNPPIARGSMRFRTASRRMKW